MAATSRVLGQSQPVQSLLECPLSCDHLCNVMCCREPLSSQSGTDIRKEGVRVPSFLRQVPPYLPCLHHPFFHQFTHIISVIGIFIVFYSDDSWWSSTDPVSSSVCTSPATEPDIEEMELTSDANDSKRKRQLPDEDGFANPDKNNTAKAGQFTMTKGPEIKRSNSFERLR